MVSSLFAWLRRLFSPAAPTRSAQPQPLSSTEPAAPLPSRSGRRIREGVGNLDRDQHVVVLLEGPQEALLWRIGERLDNGDFGMPRLPSSSVAALEMANRPSVEIRTLVEAIERDPLLTGELLRIANSALYAAQQPAATLQQAVMRIGLRSVRGAVFAAALKSSIHAGRKGDGYAEELWRQSQSVARVAREIARPLGFDSEEAYVLGLLHDIGKVVLLGMLPAEVQRPGDISPALVGRVFHHFHERAGGLLAKEWKLPADVAAVAACHHDVRANQRAPRAAALVYLAHQLDLRFSLNDEAGLRGLVASEAFEVLGTPEATRWQVLELARQTCESFEEAADAAV